MRVALLLVGAATLAALFALQTMHEAPAVGPAERVERAHRAADAARPAALVERARDADRDEDAARAALHARLDAAEGFDARFDALLVATYGSTGRIPEPLHRGPVAEYFLRNPAVQADLQAMAEVERAAALARMRTRLGFDEEQVARLAARDRRQAARWSNGLAYTAARAKVVDRVDDGERDAALAALRTEYFGARAETIRREEESGFFRFERPRILGRN